MDDFNSRHIALIQENLSKSRWKCPKICKIAKPLKTAKHFRLMRKFHIQPQLTKSSSKEAIYWTSLENKLQNISIAAFGDCLTEEIISIEEISKNDETMKCFYPVVLFKPRLFECIFVTPDFSELLLPPPSNKIVSNDCSNDSIYAVCRVLICQFSPQCFRLNSQNFEEKRSDLSKSIRYCRSCLRSNNDSNCSVVNINFSVIDDDNNKSDDNKTELNRLSAFYQKTFSNITEIKEFDDSKIYSEISNKSLDNTNNHQVFRCITPECWLKNPIVALEDVLWNSVIPRSWIFLFQFSDYYLESCILSMLKINLTSEFEVNNTKKPKEIKNKKTTLRKIKKPLIMTNNLLNQVMLKVYQSLLIEAVVVVTKLRRVPRNAMKIERTKSHQSKSQLSHPKRNSTININNSDSKSKPNVLHDVLIQSKKQIEKSIVNQSFNRTLRIHNRHKRFITPFDYRFHVSPIKSGWNTNINYKLKPRLERITIKTNEDQMKKMSYLTNLKIATSHLQNATIYYKDLLQKIILV